MREIMSLILFKK